MTVVIEDSSVNSPATMQELHAAFARFTEAGEKLEHRYRALQEETEDLRSRLQQQDEALKRSERLATLGQMAAALAHEVRNPLGAMKLFLSLLRQDVADRPQAAEMVQQLDSSVENLESLVANILEFSRETKLQLAPVQSHMLIEEQRVHCQRVLGTNTRYTLELEGNPFVLGHDGSLRQVFYNLFANAEQALRRSGQTHPRIVVRSKSRTGSHQITIEDNGPGISPEVAHRLFEPFVTTRNEGTGLGLSVVKQILDRHHATIRVEQSSLGGARFVLEFPQGEGGKKP